MKFRAYETFSLRKGWLHKGIAELLNDARLFYYKDSTPMDRLGIGSNMVKSLRYWLLATRLVEDVYINGRHEMALTDIGQVIWNRDPYFQEEGTWQIIHYLLSSNVDMATSWYFVFNKFNVSEFTKDDFNDGIKTFIADTEGETIPAERALSDDFECVVKTYYSHKENDDPESNFICPLTDLNLLTVSDNRVVNKVKPRVSSISPYVSLAILVNEAQKNNKTEIRISEIEKAPCNLGKTFNLDNISIAKILDQLRNMNAVKVTRTAGLDVVKFMVNTDFIQCVTDYYNSLV